MQAESSQATARAGEMNIEQSQKVAFEVLEWLLRVEGLVKRARGSRLGWLHRRVRSAGLSSLSVVQVGAN